MKNEFNDSQYRTYLLHKRDFSRREKKLDELKVFTKRFIHIVPRSSNFTCCQIEVCKCSHLKLSSVNVNKTLRVYLSRF